MYIKKLTQYRHCMYLCIAKYLQTLFEDLQYFQTQKELRFANWFQFFNCVSTYSLLIIYYGHLIRKFYHKGSESCKILFSLVHCKRSNYAPFFNFYAHRNCLAFRSCEKKSYYFVSWKVPGKTLLTVLYASLVNIVIQNKKCFVQLINLIWHLTNRNYYNKYKRPQWSAGKNSYRMSYVQYFFYNHL